MPDERPRYRESASVPEVTGPRRSTIRLAVTKVLGDPPPADAAATPVPRPGYGRVMGPKLLTIRSRLRRGDSAQGWRWMLIGLIGVLFWTFVLGFVVKVLFAVRATPEIGGLIASKGLSLVFVSFFMLLLLSNVITSLSTFFLARDLDLLISTPVDWLTLYAAKLTESLAHSSWMVTLIAVPIFAAYGWVYDGGWRFAFIAAGVWVPFIIIPAVLGATTTNLLVNAFPARRTRDILGVVAVISAAGLVLVFRLLRPEKLVRPEAVRSLVDFLALLRTPSSPYLPSDWAARGVMSWLTGQAVDPLPFYLLWTTAGVALVFGAAVHWKLYPTGFTKAQESASRWVRGGAIRRVLAGVLNPLGVVRRELVLKELRVFFRDTTQWSQLILLAVLVVVYVINVKYLPLSGGGITFLIVNLVPWLNLGLAGFVLASVAARFIFPAVSMEGRTLWLLKSSPLPMRQLLWSKFWTGTIPLLVLALAIVGVTDALLQVSEFIFVTSIFTITFMTFAVAGLALGLGTVFPQYETENAAQIPTSFGGLVFMLVAVILVGAVVVLEARPVLHFLRAHVAGTPIDLRDPVFLFGFGAAALLCLVTTFVPLGVALRRLEATEL
jgi:ABC-2 type transport system permease protein